MEHPPEDRPVQVHIEYAQERRKKRDLEHQLRQVQERINDLEPEVLEYWADTKQPKGQTVDLGNGEIVNLSPRRQTWANVPQVAEDPNLQEALMETLGELDWDALYAWGESLGFTRDYIHDLRGRQFLMLPDENVAVRQALRRAAFAEHGIDVLLQETVHSGKISSWAREQRDHYGSVQELEQNLAEELKPWINLSERTSIQARFEKE